MKYVIVLGDGMADWPIEALDGRTPLEYASTPMMDELSKVSEIGLLHTIPEGMKPGSDTANLSVLGYDARKYYTGRSPLEALSIGVPMKATDIALRTNIVTISEDDVPFEEQMIIDHSSGEISTEDAAVLLNAVKEELQNETYQFYVRNQLSSSADLGSGRGGRSGAAPRCTGTERSVRICRRMTRCAA